MSRNLTVNPWLCRAAGLLLGTSLSVSAWAADTSVMVGNASVTVTGPSTVVNFPVTRSGDLSYDVYLSFQTQGGSAVSGTDYSPLQGSWLLPAGVANLSIPVTVNGSNAAAADKNFSLDMLGLSTLAPNFALASQQDFPAGSNPYAVVAADVNADGKLDLIVADYASGTVTVLLNTTAPGALTPSFTAGQTFSVGSTTFAVVVADMNGDGKPDVITSDLNDGTISVLLNTTAAGATTASFAAAQTFALQSGSAASIAVADLNGDGKPDLVVGTNTGAVTVFINNTATDSTTAQLIQQSVFVSGANSTYVTLADLDGDGKPDLVVTDSSPNANTVSVLLNTTAVGSQSASFGAPLFLTTGNGPLMCVAADVNGDGKPDLIVANETDNSLSVFLNLTAPGTGIPNFSDAQTFAVAGSPRSVVAADVDGDGRPDLIVGYGTTATTGVSVLINRAEPGAPAASFATPQIFGTTPSSYLVATADVNGDGLPDVIAKDGDNVIVFLNTTTPGAAPTADLSATSLAFGNQGVGTTSAVQTVTLTNNGNLALNLSIAANGPYAQTNTCGASVAAGASCTISVAFTPTVAGGQPGSITVTDNAAGSPQSISLSGTGILGVANLSPTSLAFGNQNVGTTSAAQTVTLTNSSSIALGLNSIAVSGPYAQTNTCGTSVPAGANCTISVTFTPTASGSQSGSITISDNAADSPQTIALSGAGLQAVAGLSSTSLAFGNQNVGTTSTAQTVTLTNSGNLALSLSIAASAPYAQTNTCGTSLPAGANCTLSVTFTPTASGSQTGSITLTDNAVDSPQTVSLSGAGTGAVVGLSPTSLTFGAQALGTTSAAQVLTLTNTGNVALSMSSIAASAPFAQTNTCGTSVPAGGNCTISVTFTPTVAGAQSGAVTITDNASDSPETVSLSGTGTGAAAGLSPATLTFGNQNVGTTSAAQTVTLTNTGNLALSVTSIAASAPYAETNTCGTSVPAGGNCTISVTFTPTASGSQPGSITITDNAASSPQTIALTGTGLQAVAGLSQTSLAFGNQNVGTTSTVQTVTLTNSGNLALSVTSVAASTPYAETNTCGTSVPAGGNCTISVTFTPTVAGAQSGAVTITDNASDSPETVSLSGTGTGAAAGLSPATLTFGNQNVGTTSAAQTVTLTNTGNLALSVTSIAASAPYAETNTCGTSVPAGGNCTISVTFTPTALGVQPGSITITDNAGNSPQTISLSGTGVQAGLSLSQISLAFGNQEVGQPSAAQTVTLTNSGSASLTVSFTPSGPYTETSTCTGGVVPANGACILSVTFTPTAAASQPGSMTVTYNASGSPQAISLSGSGIQAQAALSPVTSTGNPLVFGNTTVGSTSAAQTVTLSNNGNENLNFTVSVSGPFAQANACNGSVAASGGTCAFSVTYSPTATGSQTGSITLTDNAAGSSQTIYLSGSASPPPTTITAPTSTLNDFDGNVTVSWQKITSATEYQLYGSQDGGTYTLLSLYTPDTTTSGQPPTLDSGNWTFEVRPCANGECSAMSAPSATVIVARPPTNLTFSPTGTSTSGTFTLNWDGDAFQYRVYQSSDGGVDWTWVDTANRATTSYTPPDLGNGTYVYEITSCINGGGCSADSSTASKTVSLSKPSGLSFSPSGTSTTGTFTLSWNGPSWTFQYRVYQSSNGGSSYTWVKTTNGSTLSYTTNALANGTYIYYVQACNQNACSNNSATATKTVSNPGGGGGGCPPPPEQCQLVMPDDDASPRHGIWGSRVPTAGKALPESIGLGSRQSSGGRHRRSPAKVLVVGLLENLRKGNVLVSQQETDV